MVFFRNIVVLSWLFILVGCGSTETQSREQETYFQQFMNSSECDIIVDKVYLNICYDNALKVAKSVAYTLDGTLVNQLNITERPFFYEESQVEQASRASFSDYSYSGYDRGHLAPDAAFDWSQESLDATYSLANIIPQVPEVNQEMWVKIEKYARRKAVELDVLNVINVVKYESNPMRIGKNKIAVSKGYYKLLYSENYEECFYYENSFEASSLNDTIAKHKVDCVTVRY